MLIRVNKTRTCPQSFFEQNFVYFTRCLSILHHIGFDLFDLRSFFFISKSKRLSELKRVRSSMNIYMFSPILEIYLNYM